MIQKICCSLAIASLKCSEAAPKAHETIKTLDDQCADIYRRHPFYKRTDLGLRLRQLVESPDLRRATNVS